MITLEKFTRLVDEKLNGKFEHITTEITHFQKNNGSEKTGIIIHRENVNLAPTIYIDEVYEEYRKGISLDTILNDICGFYEELKVEESWDCEFLTDYQKMKDKILFKAVNYGKNRKMLEDVPHIVKGDLVLVFYVLLDTINESIENATILINHKHCLAWNVTVKELYEVSQINAPKLLPATLQTMLEVVQCITIKTGLQKEVNLLENPEQHFNDTMYVLSNPRKMFGASSIFYDGVIDKIAEFFKNDFFVLPSSIHELIIVPDNEHEGIHGIAELENMVRDINATQVELEEILSDKVYFYDVRNHVFA